MPSLVGSSYVTFLVELSIPVDEPVDVRYETEPGTGVAGVNYEHTEGTLRFEPGETQKTVQVLVYGLPSNNLTPRTFRLRLHPSANAILNSPLTEATIHLGNPNVNGSYTVTIAQGPKGDKGDDGAPGAAGKEVELRVTETHIQWRYAGTAVWTNLVALESLRGADGVAGEPGQSFAVNASGLLADRDEYDEEPSGFSFLAVDEAKLYFRLGATGWSDGIPFGKGDKGDPGEDGKDGLDGREIELQVTGTEIQWRYAGGSWATLILLSALQGEKGDKGDKGDNGNPGADGEDGREIELQKTSTHIQWRYAGEAEWTDLIALADLKGAKGDKGDPGTGLNNRGAWAAGIYEPGDYVFDGGVMYVLADDEPYESEDPPADDLTHWIALEAPAGPAGADGEDGREVELQKTLTHIQWRYVGDAGWNNLVALADIKGDKGDEGDPGADGREIELHKGTTHIEWRYVGQSEWQALVALDDLIGPAGADGEDGADGSGVPTGGTTGQVLAKASNDDGDVEWIDPPEGGGGSNMLIAMIASDTNNSTTTLQDKMNVTVEQTGVYLVRVRAMTRPNATTIGVKVGLVGTAGFYSANVQVSYNTATDTRSIKTILDKNQTVSFTSSEYDNTGNNALHMDGVIYVSGAGTVGLGIAAINEYEYWSLMKGSVMTLEKIGNIPL